VSQPPVAVAQLWIVRHTRALHEKSPKPLLVLASLAILTLTWGIGAIYGEHHVIRQAFFAQELDRDVFLYQQAEDGNLARVKSGLGCQVSYLLEFYNQYAPLLRYEDIRLADINGARRIATITATNGDLHIFDK
jgi:hypothetical protein